MIKIPIISFTTLALIMLMSINPSWSKGRFKRADPIVVIANIKGPNKLTKAQIARLYLGRSISLPNGKRVKPVDQSQTTPVRKRFFSQVVGRNLNNYKEYWAQRVFTGQSHPPQTVSSEAAMIRYIKNNPNAIGFTTHSKAIKSYGIKIVYQQANG